MIGFGLSRIHFEFIQAMDLTQRNVNMEKLFCLFLVFQTLVQTNASPLYDMYNVKQEPDAIPLNLLRNPLQIDIPSNEVYNYDKRNHHNHHHSSSPESCCPTVVDLIEPTHGKNRSGDLVELYQSQAVRQRFYENSCAPSISNQPCRFLDRRHTSQSRCVQQYSYTYAMVRDYGNEDSEWKLDYIQVRSGCSCQISN